MAERGELDLTGAKQNTGVWLVKVRFARLLLVLLLKVVEVETVPPRVPFKLLYGRLVRSSLIERQDSLLRSFADKEIS